MQKWHTAEEELRVRYAGRTLINKLSVLSTLFKCKLQRNEDMGGPITKPRKTLSRLAAMNYEVPETMPVTISVSSLSQFPPYAMRTA